MRQRFLSGDEAEQRNEMRDEFWPATKACLRCPCRLVEGRSYEVAVESPFRRVAVRGTVDLAIQLEDCDLASATLQHAAWPLTPELLTQMVTQVQWAADRLEQLLGYAPRECVGLLQNGQQWTLVRRLLVRGRPTWTHMRARPAFSVEEEEFPTVDNNSSCYSSNGSEKSMRRASEVDRSACLEIARMIEHVYCVADDISDGIINPTKF
mmetsp:Transcript_16144/g.22058  ORF Transcript_16144/g.22058 Transcript_16144/m.22058 type:complete len:209 (+) Transcript_16144:510-1136(+)